MDLPDDKAATIEATATVAPPEAYVEAAPLPQMVQSGALMGLPGFRADPRFAGIDGAGTAVVVIDTGLDKDHPFFGADANGDGTADRILYSYDFSGTNDADATDFNGHGTNVTGIAAGAHGTYPGVAPGAGIIHLKVFGDSGGGAAWADIEEALQWVVANAAAYNVVSVNLSLGAGNYNTSFSYFLGEEMAALAAQKVAVVVASGNSFYNYGSAQGVGIPSNDPNAWSIGAVYDADVGGRAWSSGAIDYATAADRIVSFSQRSAALTDLFAPGALVTSAGLGGGLATYSGTSMAAPQVTGAVALAQQLAIAVSGKKLDTAVLLDLMRATGATVVDGDDENDNVTNTGLSFKRLDVAALGPAILDLLFAGTASADALNGTPASDTIRGAGAGDTLSGKDGADFLFGDAGDDTLTGGAGADALDGGAGSDTANYAASAAGVTVALRTAAAKSGGDAAGDIFADGDPGSAYVATIENLTGSAFNDVLDGDDRDNALFGGAGHDTLRPGGGNDIVDGGPGSDTVSYSDTSGGVTVALNDFGDGSATGAKVGTDTLAGIEKVAGTVAADTMTGGAGAERFIGYGGADVLSGGGGADLLEGGDGDDTLAGGAGNDNLQGGAGADSLAGGADHDTLDGGTGDDMLAGGPGNDTLAGGDGTDIASYAAAGAAVTVSLAAVGPQDTGADGTDTLGAIEGLIGSPFDDILGGDGGANRIAGGNGADGLSGGDNADTLLGDAGDDSLDGGAGDDVLLGGAGNDTLAGGAGSDTASYSAAIAGVTVSLAIAGAQNTGGDGTDTLSGIENLAGSAFNDNLYGDAGANALAGGGGSDTLRPGAGDDRVEGGAGSDWVSYSNVNGGVTIVVDGAGNGSAIGALAGTDTLFGVESAAGTAGADAMSGGDGHNRFIGYGGGDVLSGGGGDDRLEGGDGSDRLQGGAGADTLLGGSGRDRFVFAAPGDAGDTVSDFATAAGLHDHVDLIALFAGAGSFVDAAGARAEGFLRYDQAAGAGALVQADLTGAADGAQWVTLATLNGIVPGDLNDAMFIVR